MPWNPFGIGVHETYRCHSDVQFHFLLSTLLNGRI
jgi:hypothetical protein